MPDDETALRAIAFRKEEFLQSLEPHDGDETGMSAQPETRP